MRTLAAGRGAAMAAARARRGLPSCLPDTGVLAFRYFMHSAFPHIAVAAHGHDIARGGRIVLDFDAQAADVDVDDLELADIVMAPDHFQDVVPRQRTADIGHKCFEDAVLDLGQLDLHAILGDLARTGIQAERARADAVIVLITTAAHAPEQRLHPGDQL